MSDTGGEQYLLRVEKHFGQRRGGPLVLSPSDWSLVEGWQKQGIPLRIVMHGINQAFDRFAADGPRPDRINSLRYCEQEVLTAWQDHRAAPRRPTAEQVSANDGLSAASQHIAAVAIACREAATRIGGDSGALLNSVAADLESLGVGAARADADPSDVDRRCAELEAQTQARLAEQEPPAALQDLGLPRFSPYEAF